MGTASISERFSTAVKVVDSLPSLKEVVAFVEAEKIHMNRPFLVLPFWLLKRQLPDRVKSRALK